MRSDQGKQSRRGDGALGKGGHLSAGEPLVLMILSSVSSLSHEVASQITCQGPLQHWARESVDPGGWGKGDTIQFLQSVIYCGD